MGAIGRARWPGTGGIASLVGLVVVAVAEQAPVAQVGGPTPLNATVSGVTERA